MMKYVLLENGSENLKSPPPPPLCAHIYSTLLLLSPKWILTEGSVWVKSKYNPECNFFPLVWRSLQYSERGEGQEAPC